MYPGLGLYWQCHGMPQKWSTCRIGFLKLHYFSSPDFPHYSTIYWAIDEPPTPTEQSGITTNSNQQQSTDPDFVLGTRSFFRCAVSTISTSTLLSLDLVDFHLPRVQNRTSKMGGSITLPTLRSAPTNEVISEGRRLVVPWPSTITGPHGIAPLRPETCTPSLQMIILEMDTR